MIMKKEKARIQKKLFWIGAASAAIIGLATYTYLLKVKNKS